MKYPKIKDTGICNNCIFSNLLRSSKICNRINNTLNATVNSPNVKGKYKLNVYGILEMGDVPKSAFVIKLIPSALINNPIKNMIYRFAFSIIFCFPSSYSRIFFAALSKEWLFLLL